MEKLLEILTETIRLLEKREDLPANPVNFGKQEELLAKDMRRYFRAVDDALPWAELENLYYKWVVEE